MGNKKSVLKIGNKIIGDGYPCFIIAEAGSNHNGKLSNAKKLIDIAARSGADAVKFQTFKAEKIYTQNAGKAGYLKNKKSIYDIIKSMEMPLTWIPELAKYCKDKKIMFLSTPFDQESADVLDKYMPLYKIASYEMTDIPFIRYVAGKKKPIVMSTGTATIEEVQKSVQAVYKTGNRKLALMQCTACYPAPLESVNIRTIATLKKKFSVPVGLSDHSREFDVAPMAAVALGADCIEKHFTISNKLAGPDHKFALEPNELAMMVRKIRDVEKVLGDGIKKTENVEHELRQFARRAVFAKKDIKRGSVFTADNIAVLRKGLVKAEVLPEQYDEIIGRKSKRTIFKDQPIQKGDF